MFILRIIDSIKRETNLCLGNRYSYISKDLSAEEYTKTSIAFHNGEETQQSDIFAFVISEGGKEIYPLTNNKKHFIMTDTGKTFAHLK
jgi:hypothetical protein